MAASGAVSAVFDQIDADRSGFIETGELRRLLHAVGLEQTEDDNYYTVMQSLLHDFDIDSDGRLSKEEFDKGIVPRIQELLLTQQASAARREEEHLSEIATKQGDRIAKRREATKQVTKMAELEAELSALRTAAEPTLEQLLARVNAADPSRAAEFVDGILAEAISSRPDHIAELLARAASSK